MAGTRWRLSRSVSSAIALAAVAVLVGACSEVIPAANPTSPAGAPVAPNDDLCKLLRPADFAAVGIDGAQPATENTDDAGSWFCDYSGQTDVSADLELDAFSGGTAAYSDLAASNGITTDDATAEVGAERAGTTMNGPGYMAVIVACKGKLCFDISLPSVSGARDDLIALAKLVLQRGASLTR